MGTDKFDWNLFYKSPLIGIIRGLEKESILKVTELFSRAGFTNLEVTMNTSNAAMLISELRQHYPLLNIGAGTVRTAQELEEALTAGAQYIVTPITIRSIIQKCVDSDIPIFPGAYTPTEIYQAWDWGASAVKVFPANNLGPSYIKNVLAPLDSIKLVPTGGVNVHNVRSFFEAGAVAVGCGGNVFNSELIKKKDYDGLSDHFAHFYQELHAALSNNTKS